MKLSKVYQTADQIIDKSQRKAIVKLIDMKVESEMNKFIAEMRAERKANQREFLIMRWILGLIVALLVFLLTKV